MNYINTIFKRNATKALTLLVILLASVNAWAVDYIKPNGEVQSVAATTITSETTLLTNGWWAVNVRTGVGIDVPLYRSGNDVKTQKMVIQ